MGGPKLKVSERDVRKVIAKLQMRTGTIMGEARRLDVYHATLRKAIRREMDDEAAFKSLMGTEGRRPTGRRTVSRVDCAASQEAAQPSVVEAPRVCGHRFNSGTDGKGRVFLWCIDCSYSEAVISGRATQLPG